MSSSAFIFGKGGHAHVIASIVKGGPVFLVPSSPGPGDMLQDEFFARLGEMGNARVYLGIGDNEVRRNIFLKLRGFGIRVANCIASNTFIADDAELGDGVVLCPGSVIGSRAIIGDNTIINTLSSVDHDCTLGDHSQVTAGVTFGGTVRVGTKCFFGIKSAVIPNTTIGNNVVVMAGALVTGDLPDNVVAGGNPARIVRLNDASAAPS